MSNENDEIDEKSNEILSRLRGISSEDKTEMGKLKCRIDDQSRLIMMLKKRNDEYLLQNIQLDKHCQNLEREIDQLKDEIHQQSNKTELIEELYSTIEQLKSSNQILIAKEEQTQQQIVFYQSKSNDEQREKEILRNDLLSIQLQFKENQTQTDLRFTELRQEIQRKLLEIKEKNDEIQRIQSEIDHVKMNSQNEIRRFQSNENLLHQQLELSRCQIKEIQEKSRQIDQTIQKFKENEKVFEKKLEEKDALIDQLKIRFDLEEDKVNRDVRIRTLQENLSIKDDQIHRLEQEFNAYRIYTTSLLDKEKQINERFRNLLAGKSN